MVTLFQRARRLSLFSHLLWLLVGVALWSGRQFWQWKQTGFFSWVVLGKGLLLLWLADLICAEACRRRPSFLFLGFFPMIWLSLSRFQWEICAQPDTRFWTWLGLFLLFEFVLLAVTDGRRLLGLTVPLTVGMTVLFPFSLPLFFSFGWARANRSLGQVAWVRYGLPLAGLATWVVLKEWTHFQFYWFDLYGNLIGDLFFSFFLLGLMGMAGFVSRKSSWTPALAPVLLLPLGFLFWSGPSFTSVMEQEMLKWVLVLFAGFGWETFRRDMMDRTWHGRLVWLLMGLCFIGGVFKG